MDFINNIQYNSTSNNGYSFYQKYTNNNNYPLLKFNFRNGGQIVFYNSSNQIIFGVDAVNGLRLYKNNSQVFQIDSTCNNSTTISPTVLSYLNIMV
jgi:hypothetical protein